MKKYLIGCSGWSYSDWSGKFYPRGTRPQDLLAYYAGVFDTVEIDMTFYRYPTENAIRSWYARTSDTFLFAAKVNRTITHHRKLKGVERYVRSFLELMTGLKEKLGPLLIQLPPGLGPDKDLLENFLASLPQRLSFAVEFRDLSWLTLDIFSLLERYNVALCLVDSPRMALMDRVTADFTYVRWHGRTGASYDYSDDELDKWSKALEDLPVDRVYGYFNNDVGAHAPSNAQMMMALLERSTMMAAAGERTKV